MFFVLFFLFLFFQLAKYLFGKMVVAELFVYVLLKWQCQLRGLGLYSHFLVAFQLANHISF